MTFDDWYETYERDGGELMLYNTIDLQAAFEAGRGSVKQSEALGISDVPETGFGDMGERK